MVCPLQKWVDRGGMREYQGQPPWLCNQSPPLSLVVGCTAIVQHPMCVAQVVLDLNLQEVCTVH
jgi:hypothetical protein